MRRYVGAFVAFVLLVGAIFAPGPNPAGSLPTPTAPSGKPKKARTA